MINYTQVSVFGDFERFSTSNADTYIKLIQFFNQRGYKPSAINTFKVDLNGSLANIIMPVFLRENQYIVEFLGDRINFKQMSLENDEIKISNRIFLNNVKSLFLEALRTFGILSNRLSLICKEECVCKDEVKEAAMLIGEPAVEQTIRTLVKKEIAGESCNIIKESIYDLKNHTQTNIYDYNTIFENGDLRFHADNVGKIFESFYDILQEMVG